MALQVWLPLTKDLRQQGLCNIIPTNNNAVYNATGGKLGGCYTFTNQTISMVPTSELKNSFNGAASLTCWVKVSTSHNAYAQCITYGTVSTAWTAIYFGIDINGSGVPIGNIANGSNNTNCSFSTAIKDNQWHHLCLTYTTGTIKSYLDGVLKTTTSTSYVPAWTNATILTIGGNSSEVFKNGDAMNDVRLYNHCLSPMEVKELAKGLVLHYPLNRQGWGQENLIRNTDFGGVSQKYTVTSGTEGGFTYTPTETIIANTEYIVSCRLRGNANMNLYKLCTGGNEALNWVNRSQLSTTEYRPFSIVFTYPSSKTLNQIYICTRYGTSNTSTGDWFEIEPYSLKLEKGSIATPWCPNSSDTLAATMGLNSTTEYDCSGFCNNGEKIGTLTYDSDTPRYAVSTVFNGSNTAISLDGINISSPYTAACWIKYNNFNNLWAFQCGTNGGYTYTQFGIHALTNGTGYGVIINTQYNTVNNLSSLTDWHHVVLTFDGTICKVYFNGELKATNTISNSAYSGSRISLGRYYSGTYLNGRMSDFRIYTTVLSADDVKSLYQNSAYIDSSGNVYGAVHSEV